MAEYYVDLVGGSDSGDGSAGDPWLTIQKFLDTELASNGPHIVYLAGAAYSPLLDFATFGSPGPGSTTTFAQWPGGAQCVISTDSAWLNDKTYICLRGLKIVATGTSVTIRHTYCVDCHFHGVNAIPVTLLIDGTFEGCWFTREGTSGTVVVYTVHTAALINCVLDARGTTPNFSQTYITLTTTGSVRYSNCIFIRDNSISYTLQAGGTSSSVSIFTNNLFVSLGPSTGQLHPYTGNHILRRNVFLNSSGTFTPTGGTNQRYDGNRFVGYTGYTGVTDLGDNAVIESPYRDWQNLDFTVTKPALLEVTPTFPSPSGFSSVLTNYAGCFPPAGGSNLTLRRFATRAGLVRCKG